MEVAASGFKAVDVVSGGSGAHGATVQLEQAIDRSDGLVDVGKWALHWFLLFPMGAGFAKMLELTFVRAKPGARRAQRGGPTKPARWGAGERRVLSSCNRWFVAIGMGTVAVFGVFLAVVVNPSVDGEFDGLLAPEASCLSDQGCLRSVDCCPKVGCCPQKDPFRRPRKQAKVGDCLK